MKRLMLMLFVTGAATAANPDLTSLQGLFLAHEGQVVETISPGLTARGVVKLVAAGTDMVCLDDVTDDSAPKVPNSSVRCYPYTRIQSVLMPHSQDGSARLVIQILPMR